MKKNNKESSHLLIGDVCVYHEKKDGMIDNAYPIFDGEIATIVGFATIKGGNYAIYSKSSSYGYQIGVALEKAFKRIEEEGR